MWSSGDVGLVGRAFAKPNVVEQVVACQSYVPRVRPRHGLLYRIKL